MKGRMCMNEKQLAYCNIDKWHTKGITGKGVKVAVLETDVNPSLFGGKVKDPFNIGSTEMYSHGNNYVLTLLQVAPDIEIYLMPKYYPHSPSIVDGYYYCMQNGIRLYGKSSFLPYGEDVRKVEKQCYDKGMFFVCASGNESCDMEQFSNTRAYGYDWWYTVGAMHGDVRADYNNYGDELDIMSFSGIDVQDVLDPKRTYMVTGTSFACPWFLGMLALILQVKPKISNAELREFIKQNSADLGEKGYDIYFGNGMFRLPLEVDDMIIKMTLNKTTAYLDGKEITLDVPPCTKEGRTLVPLRFIAEALGCEVDYNPTTKEIIIKRG